MKPLPALLWGSGELGRWLAAADLSGAFFLVRRDVLDAHRDLIADRPHAVYPSGEPDVLKLVTLRAQMPPATRTIVAVGGGSVMDSAKILTLEWQGPDELESLLAGERPLSGRDIAVIAVPTTCGTGSEANTIAVCRRLSGDMKTALVHDLLRPALAILDPDLLGSIPERAYGHSAIDAVVHAVESFLANRATPTTRLVSRTALGILLEDFDAGRARDPGALERMLYGSFLAGAAIDNAGVGVAHALSYPLGAEHGVPHGLANGALLAAVLEFDLAVDNERTRALRALLAARFGANPLAGLRRFLAENRFTLDGILPRLDEAMLAEYARRALGVNRILANNVRPISSPEELVALYHSLWS